MSSKARRAIVRIGGLEVEGYQLPNGEYRFSQADAARAIEKPAMNASRFLGSKALKGLLGNSYTDHTPETIEVEGAAQKRGSSRIQGWELETVTAYWLNQASQGNKQAIALTWALLTESLERRFDDAFGIERSEDNRNQQLIQQMETLERDLQALGDSYAGDDDIRRERDELLRYIEEQGLPGPYQLPEEGDRDGD